MLTHNVFETIHNIWLQQSGKCVGCLFVVTFDDYIKVFKQNAFYRVYLNGWRCWKGPGRDELRLWQANQFDDSLQMANAIAKYTNGFSFTIKIPHLEGQKVFGSTNQRADITPRSKGNSHKHDYENFFWPRVDTTSSGFASSNVDVGKSNGIIKDEAFVLTFQGLKVLELVWGWCVEDWEVPTIIK